MISTQKYFVWLVDEFGLDHMIESAEYARKTSNLTIQEHLETAAKNIFRSIKENFPNAPCEIFSDEINFSHVARVIIKLKKSRETPTFHFYMWVISKFDLDTLIERASAEARISDYTVHGALVVILENILQGVDADASPDDMEFIGPNGTVVSGDINYEQAAGALIGYQGESCEN